VPQLVCLARRGARTFPKNRMHVLVRCDVCAVSYARWCRTWRSHWWPWSCPLPPLWLRAGPCMSAWPRLACRCVCVGWRTPSPDTHSITRHTLPTRYMRYTRGACAPATRLQLAAETQCGSSVCPRDLCVGCVHSSLHVGWADARACPLHIVCVWGRGADVPPHAGCWCRRRWLAGSRTCRRA
jgi:hypothetical protein